MQVSLPGSSFFKFLAPSPPPTQLWRNAHIDNVALHSEVNAFHFFKKEDSYVNL